METFCSVQKITLKYIIYFAINLPYFEGENVVLILLKVEFSSLGSHRGSPLFLVLKEESLGCQNEKWFY